MVIEQVKCPNCGACLEMVGGEIVTAKCEFCGTPFLKKPDPEPAKVSAGTAFAKNIKDFINEIKSDTGGADSENAHTDAYANKNHKHHLGMSYIFVLLRRILLSIKRFLYRLRNAFN